MSTKPVSKTRVDKAGALLRDLWKGGGPLDETHREAVAVVWDYRAPFNYPLTKVNANLRYYVQKAECDVIIAQRMKRLPRIVEKLVRYPNMRLSQMQDVGGCRAVLPSQDAVSEVLDGLVKNWDVTLVDDYVTQPRPTGYRAVHAIVQKDGRPIEVQLRTFGQQDWADEIERIDGLIPHALKDGDGPEEVLEYTRLLAEVISDIEFGDPVTDETNQRLAELRARMP